MPFYPVICLSASKMVESGVERRKGFLYVQGSADDHEMWAKVIITLQLYSKKKNFFFFLSG
jgi:tRNA A64-2'-O-ribosylphosphate transferase